MPADKFFDLAGQGSKDQMILGGRDAEIWRSGGRGRRDHGAGLLGEQSFWGTGLLGSRVLGTLCVRT